MQAPLLCMLEMLQQTTSVLRRSWAGNRQKGCEGRTDGPAGTPIRTKKKRTDESKAPRLAGERKPRAANIRVSNDMTMSCMPVPAYCEWLAVRLKK